MAKTITIAPITAGSARAPFNFTVTVTNDSTACNLTSLAIYEVSKSGAYISQPQFQTPNAVPGSFPALAASGTVTYGFQIVPGNPNTAGASPASNIGGLAGGSPGSQAFPAFSQLSFQAQGQTSDGATFSQSFVVNVASSLAPFPIPSSGAAQFGPGASSSTIAVII